MTRHRSSLLAGIAATCFVVFPAIGHAASVDTAPIDPARLSETICALASDGFHGRSPGTDGEKVTVPYLIDRFKALGLAPGGDKGGWTQDVLMLRTKTRIHPTGAAG